MYTVKRGDTLSKIAKRHGISLSALLAANPRYKANPDAIAIGDRLEIPKSRPTAARAPTRKKPAAKKKTARPPRAVAAEADGPFTVPFGQLTFDAEGLEQRGRFFSRTLHVPGPWSGATIGRGYDMRERSRDEIVADLVAAGVARATAARLAQTRGLRGRQAKAFIAERNLGAIEITPAQQKALFLLTYRELEGDVLRICRKHDVVAKYGAVDWDGLVPLIRDVLVDLRYRGDYTGATRERVQPPAVRNSLAAFRRVLSNEDYWVGERSVPRDRFRRRRDYLTRT